MAKVNTIRLMAEKKDELLQQWIELHLASLSLRKDIIGNENLYRQSRDFIDAFVQAAEGADFEDINRVEWTTVRKILAEISTNRSRQGYSPSETASYVFTLKEAIIRLLQKEYGVQPDVLIQETLTISKILDKLGLLTFETYSKAREEVIYRQQQEMLELSTPVIQLWDGILALPLIGTLDSGRTQVVMENLLRGILSTNSDVAILDISGVPTVDTLVAQHIIKTVSAARLMGAECIISGIRPEIAQTIVQLGVDLSMVKTRATLAGALKLALDMRKLTIVQIGKA
ncbi:STAS domain-containing protein [Heliobacterium chlorum]|uniref:STAS domain-containing protein n=1 Tax=Heliobacterium chlorum TaxID=2698 RepID=A0ABR7T2R3_HELCL|nr:STAS domain-containing protein [Heliobacterium chlorum]MBC9783831.1 STAS domain-containing protein [Heliobacterium chlorum]